MSDTETTHSGAERPHWRERFLRIALWTALVLSVLLVIASILYTYGGMERPSPEYESAYARLVSQGVISPIDERFTIPIPGCRCHSDDPVRQIRHSTYRLRECMACHGGR